MNYWTELVALFKENGQWEMKGRERCELPSASLVDKTESSKNVLNVCLCYGVWIQWQANVLTESLVPQSLYMWSLHSPCLFDAAVDLCVMDDATG